MNHYEDADIGTFGLILLLVFFLGMSATVSVGIFLDFVKDRGAKMNGKLAKTVRSTKDMQK